LSKRGAGVTLIAVAAFLYGLRYICAAIFGSGISTWNAKNFNAMLHYIGPNLNYAAAVALIFGIIYLIWAELSSRREWDV